MSAADDKEANTAKKCNGKFRGHDQACDGPGSIEMIRNKRFLQNQNCCAFDRDAGESSRPPGTGVDVDSIVSNVWKWHRRVAMHDESAVVLA